MKAGKSKNEETKKEGGVQMGGGRKETEKHVPVLRLHLFPLQTCEKLRSII
jgi:hypothetical protein